MSDPGEPHEETTTDGIEVIRLTLPVVRGSALRYVFQYFVFCAWATAMVWWLGLRERLDVIWVHSVPDFLVFCALPVRVWGVRVVLDLHEGFPEITKARFPAARYRFIWFLAQLAERASCGFADRVIVANPTLARRVAMRGTSENKIVVVENAPDARTSDLVLSEAVKIRWKLPPGPYVMYVGGINPERDLTTVIEALTIVNRTSRVQLCVFGYGASAYREQLLRHSVRFGLDPPLFLAGRVPTELVIPILRLSVVGVVSYVRNPLTEVAIPNKAYEYIMADCPLVVADLPALREKFGEAAVYYDPGDANSLADSIGRILRRDVDPEALQSLAVRVLGENSWDVMRRRLVEIGRGLGLRSAANADRGRA